MSAPEKPEAKTGKRIVSKGRYAKAQLKRSYWLLFASLCGIGGPIRLFCTLMARHDGITLKAVLSILFMILVSVVGINTVVDFCLARARAIEPVAPLTRANTGDLPAPESLVRASAEPLQAQETVLLRAATQTSETPAEQLVRPAGGQE